ncbi:MAG: caspase family protein [Marinosulfonomonas sp.]
MNRLATFALAATTSLAAFQAQAADRALVIGIDDYSALGLAQPLQSATSDAQAFAGFLQEHWNYDPTEITVLLNDQASSDAIMTVLIDKLVSETKEGDRVVFYFAGLGGTLAPRSADTQNKGNDVLIAFDGDSVLGKIPQDAIADILDIIADRKVTVITDTSFEGLSIDLMGTVGPTTRGQEREGPSVSAPEAGEIHPFGTGKAERTIWNATAPGQYAWEDQNGGVFTRAFISGIGDRLADANANGTVTNAELLGYVRSQSADWCAKTPECAATQLGLTPVFGGRVDGVAGKEKAQPVVAPEIDPGPSLDGTPAGYKETLGFVTDLFSPSNDAGLTLAINNGETLKVGDIVSFAVNANRAGSLVLLDVNPNGELVQIYPSPLSQDGATRMAAGDTLAIPNGKSKNGNALQIRVSEPAGKGFLLGLFVEDDLPALKSVLPADLAGGAIPNAGQYLYEIAQELLQLQARTTGTDPIRWSAAYLPYDITR